MNAVMKRPPSRAAGTSTVTDRHRQLRELTVRRNEMDIALLRMPDGPDCDAANAAFDENLHDCLDLQDKILKLPAECLEDAAIQSAIGYYRADQMDSWGASEEIKELGKEFRMLHASILMAIVKAGGLDIDRIGWGDMRGLCAMWGPGGRGRK